MVITLKGGETREYAGSVTCKQIAQDIGEGLARAAVAAKVNGQLVDLAHAVEGDAEVELVTLKEKEGLQVYRHTCAHVLAQAVKAIFPTSKLAIGPTIENGFYYDIDFKTPISAEDLSKIEAEMKKIIKSNLPIERFTLPRADAIKLMTKYSEKYKVELIKDLPEGEEISFYKQGGRPLPRTAPAFDGEDQGVQAHEHCGRVLARQRKE